MAFDASLLNQLDLILMDVQAVTPLQSFCLIYSTHGLPSLLLDTFQRVFIELLELHGRHLCNLLRVHSKDGQTGGMFAFVYNYVCLC